MNVETPTGKIKFSLSKTLWLYFILIPVVLIDFTAITVEAGIITSVITLLTVGIGHSVGLHRGVIHKSYKTYRLFRNVSMYLFVLNGMGSPLSWLKQHYFRDYWQNRKDCPRYFQYKHSLLKDYWWNLHLQYTPNSLDRYAIPEQDLEDPWLQWLHRTWIFHNLGFMLLIFLLTDFNTMLLATFFRSALVILGHWFIGYVSHTFGYAHYKIEGADESGYNNVLLGLLSFGEGFHNNHHSHPSSAKFSLKWYEVDFGWFLVRLLQSLGLIYDVKTPETTLKNTAVAHHPFKRRLPWNKSK